MSIEEQVVILGPGVSLSNWIANIQSALVRRRCLGHVFHNIPGIKPAKRPEIPEKESLSDAEYSVKIKEHEDDLLKWTEGEIEARNILVSRIVRDICPQNFLNMTAKQLFDHVASVREEGATTPWEVAVRKLFSTKFNTSAESYCNEFLQNYLNVNSAAETICSTDLEKSRNDQTRSYEITSGLASFMFVMGTEQIEWLDTWRQTKTLDGNNRCASLDILMSTLRQVAHCKECMTGHVQSAVTSRGNGRIEVKSKEAAHNNDPEALCTQCNHKHKNKYCFKQHSELKKRRKKRNLSSSGKMAAKATSKKIVDDSDEANSDFDEDGTSLGMIASAGSKFKNRLLYDTGASHHFVKFQDNFVSLRKLKKPFEFDQAFGYSSLTHGGISRLRIGNINLELKNSLYSPKSACNIVSAVKLNEEFGIVASNRNKILVQTEKGEERPIAKLVSTEGVLFIEPLEPNYIHDAN